MKKIGQNYQKIKNKGTTMPPKSIIYLPYHRIPKL